MSTPTVAAVEHDMDRLAWTVLIGSFFVCLLAFFGVPALGYYYVSTATVAQETELTVLSGTAIVEVAGREPSGERGTRQVPEGALIRTDSNTRVRLTTFEGCVLIVLPDTQMRLAAIRKPMFEIGGQVNQVQAELRAGRLRVTTLSNGEPHDVRVRTAHGEAVLQEGEYAIEAQDGQTDVSVRSGQAQARTREGSVQVNPRERAVLSSGAPPRGPLPAQRDLIVNGTFSAPLTEGWAVYNDQGGDGGTVNGTAAIAVQDGRRGIRFERDNSGGNHVDTGIEQVLNKDVVDFERIHLSADVMVRHQSLSGGGYLSSEFPLMIRIKYLDIRGGQNFWVRGFFYQNDARNPTANGEQVPVDLWFPYESPNLAEVLSPRPAQILSVQIYASGWDFESMVSDLSLIVE